MTHLRKKNYMNSFFYVSQKSDTIASSPKTLLSGLLIPFVSVMLKFPLIEEHIGLARPNPVDVVEL